MPELPDLVYIVESLRRELLAGEGEKPRILDVRVKEAVVIRMLIPGGFQDALAGKRIVGFQRHGPFLRVDLCERSGSVLLSMVIHFMLAGRLYVRAANAKPPPRTCFSLRLDDGRALHYADEKKMGKVYVAAIGGLAAVPGYLEQGVDITGADFDLDSFRRLIHGRRHQVRVFLMDQRSLSAIGNAYADEILFDAKIHPKTLCSQLSPENVDRLYGSIVRVIEWGIREVKSAAGAVEDKVRGHMRIRNRKGEACLRCGTTIRRTSVLGYDSFFCPRCQPTTRKSLVPWEKLPGPGNLLEDE